MMYLASIGTASAVWLASLLVAWAGLLFGGLVLGRTQAVSGARMPAGTRLGSSLVLVIAAWSWLAVAWATPARSYGSLIATGMTLCFLGDLLMARVIPLSQNVLGGMAAFGAGHVAYIVAAVIYSGVPGPSAGIRVGAWAAWVAAGILAWYVVVHPRSPSATPLHWAALPYTLLLSSTAGTACGLALHALVFLPFALGAALFLFSDLLIAVRLFHAGCHRPIDDLIWLTYGPGQLLIVFSVGAALAIA